MLCFSLISLGGVKHLEKKCQNFKLKMFESILLPQKYYNLIGCVLEQLERFKILK